MNVIWKILLTFDADAAFYKFKFQTLDYDKIEDSCKNFRVSFLFLLLKNKAVNIESSVGSSVVFEIELHQDVNPIDHFKEMFSDNFDKEDFRYMILASTEIEHAKRFHSNDGDPIHIVNFSNDLRAAKKLLSEFEN